ncbi:MAG: hypothetical protein GX595_19455 [Lentisphaerae bacterium]|nr:hypothetical protein [Lentisphaerota bacterium]
MRLTTSFLRLLAVPAVLWCGLLTAAEAVRPARDGTLADLGRLGAAADRVRGAFGAGVVALDGNGLGKAEFVSRRSEPIRLKAGARYTLLVRYRSQGDGMLSAGVQWQDGERPAGLVEVDDLRAALPASSDWREGSLTFLADRELTRARILLKAYGGSRLEVERVTMVEGWYAD